MLLIYIIIISVTTVGIIFILTKLDLVVDNDDDGIPDVVEEKVEDVKYRIQRIKEEFGDIAEASENLVEQIKDIKNAAKGEARKGRKKQ